MIVTCPQCGAESRVVDSDVPATGAKMQCAKCTSLFLVRPPSPEDAQKLIKTQRVQRPPKIKKAEPQKTQRVERPAKKTGIPDPKKGDVRPAMSRNEPELPPEPKASFVGPASVEDKIAPKPTAPTTKKKSGKSKAGPISLVVLGFAGLYFFGALFLALWSVGLPFDGIAMPVAEALGARPPRSSTGRDTRTAPEIETRAKKSAGRGDLLAAAVQWRRAATKASTSARQDALNDVLEQIGRREKKSLEPGEQ